MLDPVLMLMMFLLLVLLGWQLWRSPLGRRWRVLWLLVVLALAALLLRPLWPQQQRQLVVLSASANAAADASAAAQLAAEQQATLVEVPSPLIAAALNRLQQHWRRDGGAQVWLVGDGLPEAAWQALSPTTVIWQPSAAPVWQLHVPARIALGDALPITVQAPAPAAVVQILDAAEQLLADASVQNQQAALRVRPAAAGQYDWQLRVRDAAGNLLREAPLSFSVEPIQTAAFVGRFAAPSFEQRALRDWLQQTGMRGEFITQTGQQVQRRDRFNAEDDSALARAVQLYDLRSWLALGRTVQQQRLADVRAGASVVLLSDGSEDAEDVRRQLTGSLAIEWESLAEPLRAVTQNTVSLQRAAWLPVPSERWQQGHDRAVLRRAEQAGQLIWIGLHDSHRLWQRDRAAYAALWQQMLSLPTASAMRWHEPELLLRQQPGLLCLDEAYPAVAVTAGAAGMATPSNAPATPGLPRLQLRTPTQQRLLLPLQPSAWPGRVCAPFTPTQAGWFQLEAPLQLAFRVHDKAPWQETVQLATQRATAQHSQRLPPPPQRSWQPLPDVLAFTLLVAALALIWWRERLLRR